MRSLLLNKLGVLDWIPELLPEGYLVTLDRVRVSYFIALGKLVMNPEPKLGGCS